jgi:PAS domain S-box-containing protein
MGADKIKILHLEDSDTDVEHIHRVLTRGEIHFTSRVVDIREDYMAALREFEPDIVVSDHSMPTFNSLEALDILRTSGIDIPFILLTGAVSEEFAAEVMLRGADDYILKDRPKRLPTAILSTIDKYSQRRERERQEAQLRSFFDGSMDVLCSIDSEGRFINVSAAAEKTWGYKPAELVGKKYMDLVSPDDHPATMAIAESIMTGIPVTDFQNHYTHKNGDMVSMTWSARWDAEAQVIYAVARDCTEKLKAQKAVLGERKRIMDMFRDAPVSMCMVKGENHIFEMANLHFRNRVEIQDIIGRPAQEVLPQIEEQGLLKLLDTCYHTGEPYAAREMLLKKDNHRTGQSEDLYVNVLLQPMYDPEGRVEGIGYFAVHVTEQVLARKKIEESYEKLKAAESLQSSILNSLPAQVALLDSEGNIIAVNQTWKDFAKEIKLGSKNHGLGENYIAASASAVDSDQDIGKKMADGIKAVIEGSEKSFFIEYRCDSATEKRWFLARVAPTVYGDERGAVIIHSNVTDRKLADEKIKASEANLAAIIENADAHIYSLDREFRFITFNSVIRDSMRAYYGIEIKPGDKVYGFLEKIDPAEALEWQRVYTEALSGYPVRFVKDYSRPGLPYYLNFSINPIFENGSIIGLSCFARDITEIKNTQKQLEKANRELTNIFNNIDNVIYSVDMKSFKLVNISSACERIYGYKPEEFYEDQELWNKLIHPDDMPIIQEQLALLQSGKDVHNQYRVITANGSILWIENSVIPTIGEDGRLERLDGISRDITERKRAEDKIIELNENLEKRILERTAALNDAIKELEAFNYTVSHDLQSPLRVISGFSKIILDDYGDKMDDTGRQYLNYISENTVKMSQLIKDLLAFARVGEVALTRQQTEMRPIVDAIITQAKMETPDLAAVFTIGDLGHSYCDETLITQVWENLINNAVKYSRKNRSPLIEIGTKTVNGKAAYYVKDNGAGFDMRHADRLFGVFKRLHTNKEFEGSGVGLATVHRIMAKHGGEIWADAKIGEGATFYFTLPNA